ncbi:UvrB/UvrC motif-containing protein [Mycoplasmoides alvi]|uniref:UvrB/UvrC motif-containing protein n=1 Tax=Mycoplasmoides alvi TaxID=78580 RepID=UPI00051B0DCD|nr:UvrB/UvrC motif-containing protein [Mycoplasmoides alvi]
MVVLFQDHWTYRCLEWWSWRRNIQLTFNKKHQITPKTIIKPIYSDLGNKESARDLYNFVSKKNKTKKSIEKMIDNFRKEMLEAAKKQQYEKAAELRDIILELEAEINNSKK